MRLNSADPSAGPADLKTNAQGKRGAIKALVEYIRPGLDKTGIHADENTDAAERECTGWATGSGLKEAHDEWELQVQSQEGVRIPSRRLHHHRYPGRGDIAQRAVDGAWNEWLKGVTAEEGLLARERISSGNDAAQTDLDKLFESWGKETRQSSAQVGAAQREAQQSYTSGRESAYDALRERK